MLKKHFRKIKSVCKCFYPKIPIVKQSTFHFDHDILQLVIIRRRLRNGTPFNTVWLIGPHRQTLHKLYHWSGEPNRFGKRYNILMRTFDYWIDIRNPHNLNRLCRKCKVQQVILIQMDMSHTDNYQSFL